MNTKSFVFFAAMALVLVGCNKEKEESMETAAVSTEQQQQALPVVSNNAVPAAPAASMPEQGNVNVVGQQAAIPQAPQEAVVIPSQQAVPTVDLQDQVQPAQQIQPSQLVQAAPVESVTTTTTTTTQESIAPVSSAPVAIPPVAQPVVPQSTMVMADQLAPTQNAQGMQQNVVGNTQAAIPSQGAVSVGTAAAVGQATDVVGAKV